MRHIVVLLVSALGFFAIGTAWCEGAGFGKPDRGRHRALPPGFVGRALHRRTRRPLFLVIHRPSARRTISRRVRPPDLRRLGSHQREHSLWDASLCARNKSAKTDGVGVPCQRKEQVKTCLPLPNGRVAVLNSQEQAILELESGTGQVLHRIPVPAEEHSIPATTSCVELRRETTWLHCVPEKRFVEVDSAGKILRSLSVPSLPALAQTLSDGTTLCSGRFGLIRFDANGGRRGASPLRMRLPTSHC